MRVLIHPIEKFSESIHDGSILLDVGALNFSQYKRISGLHKNVHHYGIDYCEPTESIPENYVFKLCDLNREPIPFEDDFFDYIVASHIIEHLNDPLEFYKECIRVLKPVGKLYLEAPSERSINISGAPFGWEEMTCFNLYDDPTHTKRPWTGQSYYRLAKYYNSIPLEIGYIESWMMKLAYPILYTFAYFTKNIKLLEKIVWWSKGWAVFMISTKMEKGTPKFHYYIDKK